MGCATMSVYKCLSTNVCLHELQYRPAIRIDRAYIGADSRLKTMDVGRQWGTDKRLFSQAIAVGKPHKGAVL